MFKNKDRKIIENQSEEPKETLIGRQEGEYTESQKSPEEELLKADSTDEKIRKEIENMDLDEALKMQAQDDANNIQPLGAKEKIEKLLQAAKTKGVVYAIHMAKKMDDPYILDTFHDALAKEGYYKKFLK